MSSFTEATFEDTGKTRLGRRIYRIKGPEGAGLIYYVGFVGSNVRVYVPEGFETDGPSVWPWLRWLIDRLWPCAPWMKACAVHDCFREDLRFSKLEGDDFFHMAMETEGTPFVLRELARFFVGLNQSRGAE